MSQIIDLLKQGGTVVLPSAEKAASISIVEIEHEDYVKLDVETSRSSNVTNFLRLRDVTAFHEGPFELEPQATPTWERGERAHRKLKDGRNLSGFVAVPREAQILLEMRLGISAGESHGYHELLGGPSPLDSLRPGIFDRPCIPKT